MKFLEKNLIEVIQSIWMIEEFSIEFSITTILSNISKWETRQVLVGNEHIVNFLEKILRKDYNCSGSGTGTGTINNIIIEIFTNLASDGNFHFFFVILIVLQREAL